MILGAWFHDGDLVLEYTHAIVIWPIMEALLDQVRVGPRLFVA